MVSFRRCILALTVLALFAGLASAQNQPLSCATNISVTPTLRAEGYTEQTGDISLICSGGFSTGAVGTQIPAVNIQVFLNTAVTSRLLPVSGSANQSEALLLIDEPGSGIVTTAPPFFGPLAPQNVCATPTTGCTEYVNIVGGQTVAVDAPGATAAGRNVFQGIVQGNSVTFFGIPVLPPVTAGGTRVYRMTNIRANATLLGGGSAAGATPVVASISISGATSLQISNPTPTVGFVQNGLSASASSATSQNQCNSANRASINTLSFAENFGTAFKTRVAAQTNTAYAGQGTGISPNQNVPGVIYNSESNFVLQLPGANGGGIAGLADYGTRLKATFTNLPLNVRLFVSTTNVNNNAIAVTAPGAPGGSGANVGTTGFAQLVASETINDGTTGGVFFPATPSTDVPSTGNTPIVEIPVSSTGTATAVWEVINTNPNALETLKFGVYSTYTSNVAQNSPPTGSATVALSFAPTPNPPTTTASAFAAASPSLTIPRFISDASTPRTILNINICRTILLYPFVTNIQGFDTGLAIANTSTDPFGTGAQAGKCLLNWYQGASNPPQTDTGSIASGTVYTTLASQAAPGVNGYMIAVCSFQYAHGFAFISDLGARNLAMGYLALVVPDPATNSSGRVASPLSTGAGGSGENIGH